MQRYIKNVKKTSFNEYLFKNYVHMKKIIRLTESELKNIVEKSVIRAINEDAINEIKWKNVKNGAKKVGKGLATGVLGTAALGAVVAANDEANKGKTNKDQETINAQVKKGLGKDVLKPGGKQDSTKTAQWPGTPQTKQEEARISRAVMESIKKLMNGKL